MRTDRSHARLRRFGCLTLLVVALGVASEASAQNRALGVSYKSSGDTSIAFSEFFAADHSIAVRFMPQFPNAYEGVLVGENGGGRFVVGQGDFHAAPFGQTKLYLAVGSQSKLFPVSLSPGRWYHLAVVATRSGTQRLFSLYLNGAQLGTALSVAANDPQLPTGVLRLGKRTSGQTLNGHDAQFYGFIDDLGVFNRALSAAQVGTLSASLSLSGSEPGLFAGYTFDVGPFSTTPTPAPPPFNRLVTLNSGAVLTPVSSNRNNTADAAVLPLPTQHAELTLPFKPGEAWQVIQGFDQAPPDSHSGYASFCWDFVLAGQPQGGLYPNGSANAPLYSVANGLVTRVEESFTSGGSSNTIEVQVAPGEIAGYLHLPRDGAIAAAGNLVERRRHIALAGDTGVGVGHHHLHLGMTNGQGITFPVAFTNYEVRDASGVWRHVARGIPKNGEVVRVPLSARDVPLTADFDRDGESELVIWRPTDARWYALRRNGVPLFGFGSEPQWGQQGDIPVVGDFDGNGGDDLGIWRPAGGHWFVRRTDGSIIAFNVQWGLNGDTPMAGDFDGDGKDDFGIYRPSTGQWFALRTNGTIIMNGVALGIANDVPVVGDFDRDGRDDVGVWRPATGRWYAKRLDGSFVVNGVQWGLPGDVPLVTDFDRDGRDDLGIWRPSSGNWYAATSTGQILFTDIQWGIPSDVPLVGDFDRDGKGDLGIWRRQDGRWFGLRTDRNPLFIGVEWGLPH